MSDYYDHEPRSPRNKTCLWGKFVVVGFVVTLIVVTFNEMFPMNSDKKALVEQIDPTPTQGEALINTFKRSANYKTLGKLPRVDFGKLKSLQEQVNEVQQRIWNTWDVSHYPNFLKIMQIPLSSWNIQKSKFIALILEAMTDSYEDEFVVGFSGSSVTAGHGKISLFLYISTTSLTLSLMYYHHLI